MNIIAITPWYGANAPRFLVDAMERCGAKVYRVGPSYRNHLGMEWDESEMPKIDFQLPKNSNWYIDDYVDAATRAGCAPDLVFISEESYNNLIINTDKIPSAIWSLDGWAKNFDRVDMIQPTVAYTNHPYGIRIQPRTEEDPRWKFMPGATAPWLHKYLGLERSKDFCLFSSMYGKRKEICEKLGFLFNVEHGQAKTPEYIKHYNRALCTLHNPQPGEIKWRFFEAASAGCINISWGCRLFERLGYRAWVHFYPINVKEDCDDPWPSISMMLESVKAIKENPTFYRRMADLARQHTIGEHTYYHRAQQIFTDLGFKDTVDKSQQKIYGAWKEHLGEIKRS